MAAEIRVDTIKGRSGINTFSFKGDGFSFDQKVGIGTTIASDPVKVTNAGKIAVGVVTCHTIFAGIVTGPGAGVGIKTAGGVIGYGFTTLNFIGTGNTFATSGNTVDISIAGGGGGGVSEEETAVSSTSATAVGTFAKASFRSAAIIAQITQGSAYQIGRYLLIHDGTTVTVVEEAAVATGSMLGTFSGAINGSNVEFKVTMGSSSSATVTVKIDTVSIP